MIILLTGIFFVLLIIGIYKGWDNEPNCFFAVGFVICLIITAIFAGLVINGRTINSKIEMYSEENQKIEDDMDVLVEQYMNYESGTYGELKSESSITLVSLYPELKADTLVEKQIEVYVVNNEKIKTLKEKLINVSNYRWWLYFGH